jgi:hypothetical protein
MNTISDLIIDGRLSAGTRRNYGSKVSYFLSWLKTNHPEFYDNQNHIAILPVSDDCLKQFFGHVAQKKDDRGNYLQPTQWYAFETVSGYKSAIKDYYKANKIIMSKETTLMCDFFLVDTSAKLHL